MGNGAEKMAIKENLRFCPGADRYKIVSTAHARLKTLPSLICKPPVR